MEENNTNLEYCKHEVVRLKDHFNEKWLQDRIEKDTSLLGLGDLTIIQREHKQSTGGRIDFLLHDPETETMYETEIMLGPTNESHIIRAIEYWDIERRRYPSKDHKAVIIAEEITNRFFNVISLMNRSIPIIAIQVNAIKTENKIFLVFTKVLDIYEEPEEEGYGAEVVDRGYWENKSNPKSISMMDDLISNIKDFDQNIRITYNKYHVALGTQKRNFCWFHPRKKEGYCHFDIRVGKTNLDEIKGLLEESGISFTHRREDLLSLSLQKNIFIDKKDKINTMLKKAWEFYS
jgi:hypothetical protein